MFSKTYLSALALVCTQAIKIDIEASASVTGDCWEGKPGCDTWGTYDTPMLKNVYCRANRELPLCEEWLEEQYWGLAQTIAR